MVSLNLIGYLIYLPITFYITFYVGRVLYRSGEAYLNNIFDNDTALCRASNNFLLTGYYLLNLGYATVSVTWWNKIENAGQLVNELSFRLGFIITLLGIIHYFNMYVFWRFAPKLKHLFTNLNKSST
jgi:glucan phosphoethanolaminetransferase (alkaline phosphatase superfamily)